MEHKRSSRRVLLVGLALFAVVALALALAVWWFAGYLSEINSDVATAIIAAAGTVFVAVVTVVLGRMYEARAAIQREHREKKIPIYEGFIKEIFGVLMSTKTGAEVSEQDMIRFMFDYNQRLMVWASDEVLAAWIEWKRQASDDAALRSNPMLVMLYYEKLILAIRRDLGHKNVNLKTGDVLALFINDIDSYLARRTDVG